MNAAMTPADVLDAAADYIDERGWTQGRFVDGQDCLCALGAMNFVATGNECYTPATDKPQENGEPYWTARYALGDSVPTSGSVADWNDAPERTAEEVTATMRRVAADLRAEASA